MIYRSLRKLNNEKGFRMKSIQACAVMLVLCTCLWAQNNPVPLINNPLVPGSVAPGGPALTLTVNGTGFVPSSVVNWNNGPLVTTFVSSSQLTATLSATQVSLAGAAMVTVTNPKPGGGTSNGAVFEIAL